MHVFASKPHGRHDRILLPHILRGQNIVILAPRVRVSVAYLGGRAGQGCPRWPSSGKSRDRAGRIADGQPGSATTNAITASEMPDIRLSMWPCWPASNRHRWAQQRPARLTHISLQGAADLRRRTGGQPSPKRVQRRFKAVPQLQRKVGRGGRILAIFASLDYAVARGDAENCAIFCPGLWGFRKMAGLAGGVVSPTRTALRVAVLVFESGGLSNGMD